MNKIKIAGFIILLGTVFFTAGLLGYFYASNNGVIGNKCLVQFDSDGGKLDVKEKKVDIDGVYGDLPVPVKKGYTFDGWFTEKDGGDKVDSTTKVTKSKSHVLYASWTYNIYDLEPIVSVNTTSKEDGDYFGGLYSSSKYKMDVNSTYSSLDFYSDNNGELQYDSDGALLLDENNAVAILDVDKKYLVADSFTVSTTIFGDYSQGGGVGGEYGKAVVAISGEMKQYLCWIGIYKNYLHIYSFINMIPYVGADYPLKDIGFISIDISEYKDKVMNINVVANRDRKTKVYINGEFIDEYSSGSDVLDYDHLVIGDLRPGRELKFKGKVYDFAIFDKALSAEQVKSNYLNSKANPKKK